MQRVVSINLNGNAYQVEENGYNALFAYIDAIEASVKDSPDRAERVAEIERLLAEKCQASLAPHKTVVTSSEIDRMLSDLPPITGQPGAEPAASATASSSSSESNRSNSSNPSNSSNAPNPSNPPNPSWGHRKLYQIRDGAMISGVCMGLSEYMHVDVTIIRILFVIFALASAGWGLLVYGVLMFVVPKVDTRAQASDGTATGTMPPHHWPWDDGWPWDRYGWPWDKPTPEQQKNREQVPNWQARQDSRDQRNAWREERLKWRQQRLDARAQQRAALGPGHHPFGTVMMIFAMIFAFMWLSFWTRGHFFFGWPFFWGFPHWIGIIFFFMMLRFIFMPFRASRWYGYGPYGPYTHPHYAWASMWNGLAWFMGMIFVIWLVWNFVPEFHNMIQDFRTSWHNDLYL
jgi:phage shock protein PspC (stress-responsive transcriptional regulator)